MLKPTDSPFFDPEFEPAPNGVEAEEKGLDDLLTRQDTGTVLQVWMVRGRVYWGERELLDPPRLTETQYQELIRQITEDWDNRKALVFPSTPIGRGHIWEAWERAQQRKALERAKKEAERG